jgi:hypothetical protein
MIARVPKLQISTPIEPTLPGRGFYQLEEEALYVQVGPFTGSRRFFSYLESEHVRFDIDRHGRLIFIEIDLPRRRWHVEPDVTRPGVVQPADIRWLDFRKSIGDPEVLTNKSRTEVMLLFSVAPFTHNFHLADSVIAMVAGQNQLAAIWVGDITDDLAGLGLASFRRDMRHTTGLSLLQLRV